MPWRRVRKSFSSRIDFTNAHTPPNYDDEEHNANNDSAPDPPSSRGTPPASTGARPHTPSSRLSGAFYIPNAVAQRASAYMRPEEGAALRRQLAFDALALVRQLPLAAQGYMLVRRDSSRVSSLFRHQWLQFWGELRGGMLLFFDPDSTPATTPSGPASQNPRPVQLVFSATKCILDLKNTMNYSQIKLRRDDGASLFLRFAEPHEAQNWVAVLQTQTTPYASVRLANFDSITAIGKGASGKVFLVKDSRTDARLALKVVDKTKVFRTHLTFQHVINERLVLEMCVGCPFLIQLRYSFQTDSHLYFATDFYDGGDVFSLLQANKGRLSERHARRLLAEVILALEWLHNRNIVYRDLKPENVVLDGEGHVRLADFGLAKVLSWPDNHCTQTICGTTAYAAPEMLQSKPYTVTLDLWCLGVFMYHILAGRTPFNFRGRTMEEMEEMQRTKSVRYSSSLSLEAVSLLKSLLQNDPTRRPSLAQIKRHRFFADVDWVRVARREPHPDGLDKFVSDKATKDSIYSKLPSTHTHQIATQDMSSSSLMKSSSADVKSSALDKYLLRNINAEEWRNVSFSEDEDVSTVTEFPVLLKGRGKYMETCAIAAWAWTCRTGPDGGFVSAQPALNGELYETPAGMGTNLPGQESFAVLSPRRSLPERRYSRAAGERPEPTSDFMGVPRMSFQENTRRDGDGSQQPLRSMMRRSFRKRRETNELGRARNHSMGHDLGKGEIDGGRDEKEKSGIGHKFSRSVTEKRGFLKRRQSSNRRSADYSQEHHRRRSNEYSNLRVAS